uniref:Uncharacterized protein n=1 Tax=Aegilops tauschii subsp. strangulata TaxID=200361 RepID=A0A453LY06_AEGTS
LFRYSQVLAISRLSSKVHGATEDKRFMSNQGAWCSQLMNRRSTKFEVRSQIALLSKESSLLFDCNRL